MVQSAENSRCAPSAIARTVSSETAPYASRVSSGTLSAAVLITSAYATTPPMKVSDAPGMLVIRSPIIPPVHDSARSEEHTSELQSRVDLVCRLLLEKKKKNKTTGESRSDSTRGTACCPSEHRC